MRNNWKSKWRNLWEERGRHIPTDNEIDIDGYDYGAGKLDRSQVQFLIRKIRFSLGLNLEDRLMEAGCGAGMLLKPLSAYVYRAVGVDYASSMVRRCKSLFPSAETIVAEVGNLPFTENAFNKIACFSVFQYLLGLEYAKLVITGTVPNEEMKIMADWGLKNNVVTTGFVPRNRLPIIYAAADLMVFPSVWPEPFGLVLIEAMRMEKPIVASRVGGITDIVRTA
jgi:hypothetical protein